MFTPTRTPARTRTSTRRPSAIATPSVAPSPRLASRSLQPESSLRPPRGASPAASTSGSHRLAKSVAPSEQDEGRFDVEERTLVRDDAYAVLERRGLPAEVGQVLAAADPYRDPLQALLDTLTGHALLVSRDFCFVWNWTRRSAETTTFVLPLPPTLSLPAAVSVFSPLSFAVFVPAASQPSQREPGLIVVGVSGEIRYWESVSMALSGVTRWKAGTAELAEGELVRGVAMHSPAMYLLSTSHSRVLMVTLTSIGGKTEMDVRAFDRAVGWAGSVWSFFGGKGTDLRAGILALALDPTSASSGERTAYAVSDRSVQVWRLPGRDDSGGEKLFVEQDIFGGLLEGVRGVTTTNEAWALNESKLEILDAQVQVDGNLAVLVSHMLDIKSVGFLAYAIVVLEVGTTQGSVVVVEARPLTYQAPPDPRPLSTPRLSLCGSTAFVVFVETVVMLALTQDSVLEEIFPLRAASNRFLGISTTLPATANSVALLTASASLISIETRPEGIRDEERSTESFKTKKLKSKIEQAIFFGGADVDNPLAFDLLPGFEGDLIVAAELVSAEILSSSSANMPSIIDLRAQLADRVSRARALIEYINSNGLLGKLSQTSRRRLSWDAERLAAAVALWHYHNSKLANSESSDHQLSRVIAAFMSESGDVLAEDPVRSFFRTMVASIGTVVEKVTKAAKSALASSSDVAARSAVLHESNTIVLLVFKAITRHRRDSGSLYGVDPQLQPAEPWSSRPAMLDGLQWHFEASSALLGERSRDFEPTMDQEPQYGSRTRGAGQGLSEPQAIKQQVTELSDFVLAAFEERILYLKSTHAESLAPNELRTVTERYLAFRPTVIQTLVVLDKVSHAYELAERHADFRSLVELCNDPTNGSDSRTRFFIEKYAADFAFELYRFLVEMGRLRELLQQDEMYRPLLTKFLDSTSMPDIDWINDIAIARYSHATESLVSQSKHEQIVAQKKLMLSIGKLAQVAQATVESIESEFVQRAIEAVDDDLDQVNAQQSMRAVFESQLSAVETRQSTEVQALAVTSRIAPALVDRPMFASLYAMLVKQVLEGLVLSPEDHIDLLTLKTNEGSSSGDFAAALEILLRAKTMPQARQDLALQSIWRRVYLHDDWAALCGATGLTDELVLEALRNTALFSTLSSSESHSQRLLSPAQSLFDGTHEEVAARFPEAAPEYIQALLNDYERESAVVRAAIQDAGLDGFCAEVSRLHRVGGDVMSE